MRDTAKRSETSPTSPYLLQVAAIAREVGLPPPVAEHRFAPPRRWRFDFAWPLLLIAVEIEGGVWSRGRHVRAAGYLADLEKYNAAVLLGWRVLRYAPHTLSQLTNDLIALMYHQSSEVAGQKTGASGR